MELSTLTATMFPAVELYSPANAMRSKPMDAECAADFADALRSRAECIDVRVQPYTALGYVRVFWTEDI